MRQAGLTSLDDKRAMLQFEIPAENEERVDLFCKIMPALADEVKNVQEKVKAYRT